MKNLTTTLEPSAFIAKNKQRVKQYENTVYLKNGDEFQIELYNPKPIKIQAKIKINNVPMTNTIVIRPGERIFLDRHLDDAKKLLFETYQIDSNNITSINATRHNGKISINFFEENIYGQQVGIVYNHPNYWFNSTTPSGTYCTTTTSGIYNSTITTAGCLDFVQENKIVSEIETGRIEKGGNSNQKFNIDQSDFSFYPSSSIEWKILPESIKLKTKEDFKVYCTNCGSLRKKDKHKFCPICGTKF
jgi:hypothetical protein